MFLEGGPNPHDQDKQQKSFEQPEVAEHDRNVDQFIVLSAQALKLGLRDKQEVLTPEEYRIVARLADLEPKVSGHGEIEVRFLTKEGEASWSDVLQRHSA